MAISEEGKMAMDMVQERGFNVRSYTPEQAKVIVVSCIAYNAGLMSEKVLLETMKPLQMFDDITPEEQAVTLNDRVIDYIRHSNRIKENIGEYHHHIFLGQPNMATAHTAYFNMLSEFIMAGTHAYGYTYKPIDRIEMVTAYEKEGMEAAQRFAVELHRKQLGL